MTGKYELMTGARWIEVSDEAKDLIKKLLVVEPQLRLSADEILQHGWFVRDQEVKRRAFAVIGLDGSKGDSGRGSMFVGPGKGREEEEDGGTGRER